MVLHIHRPTHRGNAVCLSFLVTMCFFLLMRVSLVVERKSSGASSRKTFKDFNLENVLRRCSSDAVNHESILRLKDIPRGMYCIVGNESQH